MKIAVFAHTKEEARKIHDKMVELGCVDNPSNTVIRGNQFITYDDMVRWSMTIDYLLKDGWKIIPISELMAMEAPKEKKNFGKVRKFVCLKDLEVCGTRVYIKGQEITVYDSEDREVPKNDIWQEIEINEKGEAVEV